MGAKLLKPLPTAIKNELLRSILKRKCKEYLVDRLFIDRKSSTAPPAELFLYKRLLYSYRVCIDIVTLYNVQPVIVH